MIHVMRAELQDMEIDGHKGPLRNFKLGKGEVKTIRITPKNRQYAEHYEIDIVAIRRKTIKDLVKYVDWSPLEDKFKLTDTKQKQIVD